MKLSIFFCLLLLGYYSSAQPDNRDFKELIETHQLRSQFTGRVYNLQVSLPKDYYDSTTKSYPVLYALDGMHSLALLNPIRQYMELDNSLEDLIIVGIQGDLPRNRLMRHRIPDYTPDRDSTYEARFAQIMKLPVDSLDSGRANAFLKSLSKEMMVFVEQHYRLNGRTGLLGHSLAGLFTGYTLINQPGLFDFYALSSPILNWNNENYLSALEPVVIPAGTEVFIAVGGDEKRLHDPLDEFCQLIRTENDENLKFHIFEGEGHFSVVAGAFARALDYFAGRN